VLLTKEKVLRQSLGITYVKTRERQGKRSKHYSVCDNVGGNEHYCYYYYYYALQMLIGLKTSKIILCAVILSHAPSLGHVHCLESRDTTLFNSFLFSNF